MTVDQAIDQIREAIENSGPSPSHHLRAMHRLKNEWPTLWNAIMDLLVADAEARSPIELAEV